MPKYSLTPKTINPPDSVTLADVLEGASPPLRKRIRKDLKGLNFKKITLGQIRCHEDWGAAYAIHHNQWIPPEWRGRTFVRVINGTPVPRWNKKRYQIYWLATVRPAAHADVASLVLWTYGLTKYDVVRHTQNPSLGFNQAPAPERT